MIEKRKVYTLIFAGGIGKRMNDSDVPKQFLEVDGRSIIIRTIEHFSKHDMVDSIIVVCLESWIDELKDQLSRYFIGKVEFIIPGGATGFQSIHMGLDKISEFAKDDDIVLLCDGVRPMLTEELITNCIRYAVKYKSAVPVTPSIDSVLYSEDGTDCVRNFDRKNIYITQAPQGFELGLIKNAHEIAVQKGMEALSSADLFVELGMNVRLYEGIRENIKVTTPSDLESLRASYYYQHFKHFAREEMSSSGVYNE